MSKDVVAGATLAAVAIPGVLRYTTIAQTPLATGLYTISFPTMVVSLLDIIRRQYHPKSFVTGEMHEVVEGAPDPVRWVILDATSITDLDHSAWNSLTGLGDYLHARGIHFGLARVDPSLQSTLDTYGCPKHFDTSMIFGTLEEAIAAFRAASLT